jgi:hypothetical protein
LHPHDEPEPVCVTVCFGVAVFVEFALDIALLDWVTEPPDPPLSMRTGELVFCGAICFASENAADPCFVRESCVEDCTPPPPLPVCVEVCVVVAVLPPSARDVALFDWVTGPSLPHEPMRTEVLSFDGWICSAFEAAREPCFVDASCVDDWTPEPPSWHPHDEPAPVWVAVCVVGALLVALALDIAVLDCVTAPPLPGLPIRTEMFEFSGFTCLADERAAAPWCVCASCVEDCTPPPDCVAVWVVGAVFVAVAFDMALFDCVTGPSSPLEKMRTEMFWLLGCTCSAEDAATAPCFVDASCVDDWTPFPPEADC